MIRPLKDNGGCGSKLITFPKEVLSLAGFENVKTFFKLFLKIFQRISKEKSTPKNQGALYLFNARENISFPVGSMYV